MWQTEPTPLSLAELLVVVVALGILGEPAAQDAFLLAENLIDSPETGEHCSSYNNSVQIHIVW